MTSIAVLAGTAVAALIAVVVMPLAGQPRARPLGDATTDRDHAPPDSDPVPARRWRLIALGGLAGLAAVVAPPLAALVLVGAWVQRHRAVVRARRRHTRAVLDALPDAVDLLLLCAGAGLALPLAHPLVAARTPPPLGRALASAEAASAAGRPRADALLGELVPLGDRAASLGHVLVDHLRYGVPLLPGLERLGLELRLDRRRRAEEDARRVPVRLLGPLITCVLPAFALLTVIPLLAVSLRSLPT